MNKLIILRGNSGSGKSTIAQKLRIEMINSGRKVALIEQDYFRRIILKEKEKAFGDNIILIRQTAIFALEKGYDVILEGILTSYKYRDMLIDLCDIAPESFVYYFDIPFEETLRRHATKSNANDFGEKEMREWYRAKDVLGFSDEQVLGSDMSEEQILSKIIQDF